MKTPASRKLWKIEQCFDGYYYIIKLNGIIIDRVRIEQPALHILKEKGELWNFNRFSVVEVKNDRRKARRFNCMGK